MKIKTKNFITAIISAGLILVLLFCFSGCSLFSDNGGSTDDGDKQPSPSAGDNDPPVEETSITFAEFIANHSDKAIAFVNDFVVENVVGSREVLSQSWNISANENDELDNVQLVYTYKTDETSRAVEFADVILSNPVDLDDIVDGTVTANDFTNIISRTDVFDFNAKTVSENQTIAQALYSRAALSDYEGTMLYSEVETSNDDTRGFEVLEQTNDSIDIHYIEVYNTSDENLAYDLSNRYNIVSNDVSDSISLSGENIRTENYTLESFSSSTTNPSDEKNVESIDELVTNYSDEVYTALDNYYLESIGKAIFTEYFYNKYELIDATWDIGNSDNITEIKLLGKYAKSDASMTLALGTITLQDSINVKDINENNLNEIFENAANNATYKSTYTFQYNPQIQGTRDELVDAIFSACGIEKTEGATRLFIDSGTTVDTELASEAHIFKVVEITDTGIKEFSLNIKEASNDTGYIKNLQNSSNFKIHDEKSYEVNGIKITQNMDTTFSTSQYVFDDEDYSL